MTSTLRCMLFLFVLWMLALKARLWRAVNSVVWLWTRRTRIVPLGDKKHLIRFYIGDTLCKIVVRHRRPFQFYMATAPADVSAKIAPYLAVEEVPVTPSQLGFDELMLWDFDDVCTALDVDAPIRAACN